MKKIIALNANDVARKRLKDLAEARNAFAILAACAALAGHTCVKACGGEMVLARWNQTKSFETLDQASGWLDHFAGATHG